MTKKAKTANIKEAKRDNSQIYNYLLIGFFAAFIILITTFKISGDDDIFWHLNIGKYIVENKTVPSADVFGFVTIGQHWIPFEWGWDILNYAAFSVRGYAAVTVLKTVFFLLMFYFIYKTIRRLDLSIVISTVIFTILILGIFERLLAKPQISSYMFFAVILFIFLDYRQSARSSNRKIYFLPLIFLLWANMHMGVLAGIGIFSIFLFSEWMTYLKPRFFSFNNDNYVTKKDMAVLFAVFGVSLLALFLNPHGMNTFTYVYSHLQMRMMEDVFEWRSPFNKLFDGTMYRYIYFFFLAGALIILYYSYKKKDLFAGFLIVVFTVFSFRSSRFSIDFMIISAVFLAIAVNYFILNSHSKKMREHLFSKPALKIFLIVIIGAACAMLPGSNFYSFIKFDRTSGFGVSTNDYPVGAVNFIKQNNIAKIGGRPFNTYNCGGYLIWEISGAMNFIDSRGLNDEIYYNYKTINNKLAGFEKKFEDYNFDYVLWFFPYLPLNLNEFKTSVLSYLNKNVKWKLVYWDDNSFVFVKNDEKYKDIIDQNEYKYVNPYYYTFDREPLKKATQDDTGRIVLEIQRNYKLNPDGIFINAMAKSF